MSRYSRFVRVAAVLLAAISAACPVGLSSALAQLPDINGEQPPLFTGDPVHACIGDIDGVFGTRLRVRRDLSDTDTSSDADMYDPSRTYPVRPCVEFHGLFEVVDIWNEPELSGTGGQNFHFDPGFGVTAGAGLGLPINRRTVFIFGADGMLRQYQVSEFENAPGQGPSVLGSLNVQALTFLAGVEQQIGRASVGVNAGAGPAHLDFNASGAFGNVRGNDWTTLVGAKVGFNVTDRVRFEATGHLGRMDGMVVSSGGTQFPLGPFRTRGVALAATISLGAERPTARESDEEPWFVKRR
jgi:hypothetical protein